ncbi:MAG TPA: hypothetical protein VFZ53_06835 [Polyangiaceae bacterium]
MSHYRLMRQLFAVAVVGAFSTVGCFVADDDDDDDGGGGEAGDSGNGGTGGNSSGAVMKFCNELYRNGTDEAEITVTFAGVEATALSGTCTPVVPRPCIAIPAGNAPTVSLTDTETGDEIISGNIPTLMVARGDEMLVLATVDDLDYPTVEAGQFLEQYVCSETDPFATMLETRSAPTNLGTWHDVRAPKSSAVSRFTRKATLPADLGK